MLQFICILHVSNEWFVTVTAWGSSVCLWLRR